MKITPLDIPFREARSRYERGERLEHGSLGVFYTGPNEVFIASNTCIDTLAQSGITGTLDVTELAALAFYTAFPEEL